jgi:transcription initiation factor TFIIIB Brf1 subunit/transcription initiation factor TFIIB
MCEHKETVDDYSTGDCVCIICGLVIDQCYSDVSCGENIRTSAEAIWRTYFLEICANLNLSESVATDCFYLFQRYSKSLVYKRFRKRDLAAYSLYRTVLNNGVGKTVEEVCLFAGVPTQSVWKIEKEIQLTANEEKPENHVDKFCYFLDLTRRDGAKIRKVLTSNEVLDSVEGCRPQNIAVAVIIIFCETCKIDKTVNFICQTCGVSVSSVRQIVKKLRNKICI